MNDRESIIGHSAPSNILQVLGISNEELNSFEFYVFQSMGFKVIILIMCKNSLKYLWNFSTGDVTNNFGVSSILCVHLCLSFHYSSRFHLQNCGGYSSFDLFAAWFDLWTVFLIYFSNAFNYYVFCVFSYLQNVPAIIHWSIKQDRLLLAASCLCATMTILHVPLDIYEKVMESLICESKRPSNNLEMMGRIIIDLLISE